MHKSMLDSASCTSQHNPTRLHAVHAVVCYSVLQRAKNLKGCFVFTSSAAAAIPNPFSVLYASTKAFISAFGASLAAEVCACSMHAWRYRLCQPSSAIISAEPVLDLGLP